MTAFGLLPGSETPIWPSTTGSTCRLKLKRGLPIARRGLHPNFRWSRASPSGKIAHLPALHHGGHAGDHAPAADVSKPGRRVYRGADEIRPVLNGLGLGIVSTSQGIRTDDQARERRLGGEVLCEVW